MTAPASSTPRVTFVSPPIEPPWNTGSKTLVRDLVRGLEGIEARSVVTGVPEGPHQLRALSRSRGALVARSAFGVAPGILHFVFTPTQASLALLQLLRALRRRTPIVWTLASEPDPFLDLGSLRAASVLVALSREREQELRTRGLSSRRIVPSVAPIGPASEARLDRERRRIALPHEARVTALYAGDLEHGDGALAMVRAFATSATLRRKARCVIGSRPKQSNAEHRRALVQVAADGGVELHWAGESPDIVALLGSADLVALPTRSLRAKVDHPLVLLEAMRLGVATLVSKGTAAFELAEDGASMGAADDGPGLRDSLEEALDPAVRHAVARRGSEYVRAAYDRMVAEHRNLYREIWLAR